MKKINVFTLFPQIFEDYLKVGILGNAHLKKLFHLNLVNIRDFAKDSYGSVDDRPFGGGDGMVLSYEPLEEALLSLKDKGRVIYLSPQGRVWNHKQARQLAQIKEPVSFICGRYAGVDSRFIHRYVDEEISLGDYILNGGELAALVVIESILRFVPGVLGHEESMNTESFEGLGLLESPQWTRPRSIKGYQIPEVFFSGHHKDIKQTRHYLSLLRTFLLRPELIQKERNEDLKKAYEWWKSLTLEEKKSCQLDSLQKHVEQSLHFHKK